MKILALTNMYPSDRAPYFGVFVQNTVEAIRRARADVVIDVLFVNGRRNKLAYAAAPLRVAARAVRGYDLIHVHYGLLAAAGTAFRGPRLVTLYGSDVENPAQLRWAAPFLPAYKTIVVMNERMRQKIGRPDAEILPPGIDLALFTPRDRAKARARLGLDAGARYVLFPSAPARRVKRFDLGDPEIPQRETPWFYAAADVLLLTSDSEGSPNVIREALAMGLPIASVDVGDVRETVAGSRFARVVAAHEPEHLATAVIELLDQGGRADGRATAARMSIDATAARYVEIYERVAGGRRRARA